MTATLWHENTLALSTYNLSCLTDVVLLDLQVSTLAIPDYARTREDHKLLDRIGQQWRARKGPSLRLVRTEGQ